MEHSRDALILPRPSALVDNRRDRLGRLPQLPSTTSMTLGLGLQVLRSLFPGIGLTEQVAD
jgi:hypothetical protein